jgi:hypothetical protein
LRTVDYLVTRPHGPIGTQTPRLPGVERTEWVLKNVTPVEATVEADGDRHLVIRDDHGQPSNRIPRREARRCRRRRELVLFRDRTR